MLDYRNITKSPLKHTYPYGTTDTVVDLGTTAEIKETVAEVFKQQPECRRVIVPVPVGDTDGVIAAEEAGLRYVLDVTQRDGQEFSLLVAEPDWVTNQSMDIDGLELK
ncbi:hypothetical protein BJP05_09135 [Corynebacterium sp. NML98-0116]|uniref:Uncharacterized protein n=2 Tax=Corynebacterium TaxID=1716 RepID=A0ABD4TRE2_9CORY|nr:MULTISPECIES: hypothetical protein [Corynebacterium]AOX06298.1 hypothetical protein BJP05_09135 [Corynebacterium sp. NML98-0116]MCO6393953.1 hypothetical protein [Corynebacterium lipophilum]MCQ4609510.1 hypothetical protein [Corynebacterium sp. CCUG 61414]MCQ4611419.1 hypothetical protein [Corynebacterium sp. CCUG 51687]MCQ4613839.1 hypothetical protein [Corynebacterium pseudogenitalium]